MTKRTTKEVFVYKARLVHGNLYEYDDFVYVNNRHRSQITCKIHGMFKQNAWKHLSGQGCRKCGIERRAKAQRSNTEEFVNKAILIHDDLYEYDDFVYVDNSTKGNITCKTHGMFPQTASDHLSGYGCPKCGNDKIGAALKSNTAEFVIKAKLVHGDLYEYDDFVYVNNSTKGNITCKTHGMFPQDPSNHLAKHGCPSCVHQVSKPETEWLDSLNVSLRQYKIQTKEKKINVDGYDPETNTVYQFHGDYWHGNPQKYPDPFAWNERTKCFMTDLYERTIKNDEAITKSGYKLITMWESDYLLTDGELE